MTDFEFYAFWGSCLGFVILFAMFIGVLEIIQRKKNRQAEIEANKRRRAYEKEQANKNRWEKSMVESEKLFEEVVK
jgi:amino acid permease